MGASEKTETGSPFALLFLYRRVSSCYFKATPVLLWSSLPAPGRLLLNHVLYDTPFTTLGKIPPENSIREGSCSWPTLPASLLKGRQ